MIFRALKASEVGSHEMCASDSLCAYARQAKTRGLEIDAAGIRMRAERRIGAMMAESPKAPGGIDKNFARRATPIADLKQLRRCFQRALSLSGVLLRHHSRRPHVSPRQLDSSPCATQPFRRVGE